LANPDQTEASKSPLDLPIQRGAIGRIIFLDMPKANLQMFVKRTYVILLAQSLRRSEAAFQVFVDILTYILSQETIPCETKSFT